MMAVARVWRLGGAAVWMAVWLAACAVGPDYQTPDVASDLHSEAWGVENSELAADIAPLPAWWEAFGDPILTELMQRVARQNLDIRMAVSQIDRARAMRQSATAPFFPQIGASVAGERSGLSEATQRNRFFAAQEVDSYNATLDVSWEIDLFGRLRRGREAATARLQAAEEHRRDVLMVALAEAAQNYFALRGLQKRIAVNRHNIELLREVEQVAKSQFEAGITTEFDYTTAKGEREQVEAMLPALEAEQAATIYRLSVLAAQDPQSYMEWLAEPSALPSPPDVVALGVRSELLRRRPDIRRAERELAASNAAIGVAIGDLFPRLTLLGRVGTAALLFPDLFSRSGLTHGLGAQVGAPVFLGGAGWANIDISKAENRAAVLAYQRSILLALEEAEAALVRYDHEWKTLQLLQSAHRHRSEAYRIARLRYESGEENFLVMLEAERTLVNAEDQLVQSEIRILSLLTQLYKALGGGWEVFEPQQRGETSSANERDAGNGLSFGNARDSGNEQDAGNSYIE